MTTDASPAHRAARALETPSLAPAIGAARPWIGLGAAVVAGVVLFWAYDALPFMDLPAHAGLIAMRHRFAESAFEQQYFVFDPHVGPYSLFRALGELFDRIVGPVGAVRALATLPVIATPLALVFARRRLHRDVGSSGVAFGYLGLILSFGLMTVFGFASYLLGEACLVVVLTQWLELLVAVDDRDPRARRLELLVAATTPLLFVAHGHAFILFLVCAGVAALAAGDRARRIVRLRAFAPAIALAAWVAWQERTSVAPAGSIAVSEGKMIPFFQGASDKLSLLVTPTLMTRSGIDAAIGVAIWAMLLAGIVATARALRVSTATGAVTVARDPGSRHTRALLAAAGVLTALFLALPHSVGWFGFVDGRLVPLVLFLGLMAVRLDALNVPLRFAFERLAPALAAAVLLVNYVASYRFQDEARGYREVLAEIPAQSRLLNLPLDPNSDVFTGHPFVHYDKLVLADRPVVVSDVWFHQGTALYPRPDNPALRLPADYVSSDLRFIDWSAYKLEDWDYVLVRTRPSGEAPPPPASVSLVDHRGGWWLYKSAAAVAHQPARSAP
jgi:hypothetical protein